MEYRLGQGTGDQWQGWNWSRDLAAANQWLPNRLGQMIRVEQGCIQVNGGADRGYVCAFRRLACLNNTCI